MTFEDLDLNESLLRAVRGAGYDTPTPIQRQAIPPILEGRDVLGCAQTGTGKTAAFALPILDYLAEEPPARGPRRIRVLVLSPTRELATQIGDSFAGYGKGLGLAHTCIFGGVPEQRQRQALARGVDIVVATPGRLLDLMQQRVVDLGHVEVLVLDEADRLLDAGFEDAVKRIVAKTPSDRQTLLFSATMPPAIESLARKLLVEPVRVAVTPVATPAERVDQCVVHVEKGDKRRVLRRLLADPAVERALVFTRTKRAANRVAEYLSEGTEQVEAIHGNKSQNARERALDRFRRGAVRVLVATDLAARGIDVQGVSHVINFELPDDSESYVHRIGRTGRAGAAGRAIALCDASERGKLRDIERLMRRAIPVERLPAAR
ncbi:MAG: DEAD/DEAH box helicase [Proteobacteria bacterium]|nr:MAG: DEAD/DEAH box helicase [Pseudomonadota bacterium]